MPNQMTKSEIAVVRAFLDCLDEPVVGIIKKFFTTRPTNIQNHFQHFCILFTLWVSENRDYTFALVYTNKDLLQRLSDSNPEMIWGRRFLIGLMLYDVDRDSTKHYHRSFKCHEYTDSFENADQFFQAANEILPKASKKKITRKTVFQFEDELVRLVGVMTDTSFSKAELFYENSDYYFLLSYREHHYTNNCEQLVTRKIASTFAFGLASIVWATPPHMLSNWRTCRIEYSVTLADNPTRISLITECNAMPGEAVYLQYRSALPMAWPTLQRLKRTLPDEAANPEIYMKRASRTLIDFIADKVAGAFDALALMETSLRFKTNEAL